MATSLIKGLIAKGISADKLWACDIDQQKLTQIQQDCGISIGSAEEVVAAMDVVVIAVKPQVMNLVCKELNSLITNKSTLFVSIAAGITLKSLQNWLGIDKAIVRCMPNTPALVQAGATAAFANTAVSEPQKVIATQILAAVGTVSWLDNENALDAVTALSGSGPAYFFLLMEAMEEAATNLGLDATIARELTIQTAFGAAMLVASDNIAPAELRKAVTSPGGTTEAALNQFASDGFRDMVDRALKAASARSVQLAAELGDD